MLVRSIVFRLKEPLPNDAKFLMEDFRLAVNNAIRFGMQTGATSRNSLNKLAYKDFRKEHPNMYAQHLVCAFEVAGSILKRHRRRLRKRLPAQAPFVRRLFMKAAGGLRFDPGAFQHDAVMVLCGPSRAVRPEPNGTSGIRAVA